MNGTSKALFLLILIVGAAFFVNNYMAVYETGFTVTSITTSPNIITPSTNLNSANFLITTVFNGGGQSIIGYLSPDEIKAESGYETEYPLTINAQAVDEVVDYPIVNQPNLRMYKYEVITLSSQWSSCPGDPEWVATYYSLLNSAKYCIYEKDVGAIGYLDNPTTSFNTKIILSARGQTFEQKLNSFDATSASFYDDSKFLATATWTGNLVTGNLPPSEALYVSTYRTDVDNSWHVTYKGKYDDYVTSRNYARSKFLSYENPVTICGTSPSTCQALIESSVNTVNTELNTLSTGIEPGVGDATTKVNPSSLTDSSLRATFDRTFANPQVTFLINAAWVGVKFGVGQPEIVSAVCPEFASGDDVGVCTVVIKNIGEAVGTFRASFIPSTGSSFLQQYVVNPVTIQPGDSTTVSVYISHGTSVEETSTGTIKVIDINDASRYDTKTVSLTMTEPKSCIPNAEEARGSSIYKCNPQGTGWDLLITCESGTVPKLNDAGTNLECAELTDPIPGIFGSIFDWFDGILDSIFGDGFGFDDIIPLIITIIMVLVILYLLFLTLPILIPLIGKTLLGLLIGRK